MEITISLQLRLFLISFLLYCVSIYSFWLPILYLKFLHLNIRHLRGQRKCTPIRYNAYSREINHMFTVTFQISLYSNYLTFFSRNFISECLRYEQVGFLHALSHKKIFTCSLPVSVDWSRDVEIVSHACFEPSTQPDVSDTVKHVLYIY